MISFASGCPLTPVDPDLAGQACLKKHLDNDCGIYSTETYRDFIANRHEVSAQNVGPDNLSTLANETTDVDLPSRLHLFQRLPGGGAGPWSGVTPFQSAPAVSGLFLSGAGFCLLYSGIG